MKLQDMCAPSSFEEKHCPLLMGRVAELSDRGATARKCVLVLVPCPYRESPNLQPAAVLPTLVLLRALSPAGPGSAMTVVA